MSYFLDICTNPFEFVCGEELEKLFYKDLPASFSRMSELKEINLYSSHDLNRVFFTF